MDSMVSASSSCRISENSSHLLTRQLPQEFGSLDFANPLSTTDVLNDFDFDSFLHDNEGGDGGFDFSSTGNFMDTEGIET